MVPIKKGLIYYDFDTHLRLFHKQYDDAEIYLTHCSYLTAGHSDRCNSKSRGNIVPPRDETDTYRLPGK